MSVCVCVCEGVYVRKRDNKQDWLLMIIVEEH